VNGIVLQINASKGGVPKLPVPEADVSPLGIVGDAWRRPFHGGTRKAILLITAEGVDYLVARGFPLFYGAMGENVTTRGLDRRMLRIGQHYRAGEAVIQLREVRLPCATLDVYGRGIQAAIYDANAQAGDPASACWGLSGFYASVVNPGGIRAGDAISLIDP
jgi:MOSC domain-containing protein YiiM